MKGTIRRFLLLEGASFILAGLAHFGVLVEGYQDPGAATAESVIGIVLLAGFALTWVLPARTGAIGVATQGFALIGTLIGVYVGVIGVGPSTVPDVVFHVAILLALLWGLVVAVRADRPDEAVRLTLLTVAHTLIRGTGLLQLALGLAFWTGTLLVALPFHIFNGLLFVLLLEIQAALAAFAGAAWRLVALVVAWGFFVPVLGMTQSQILPGDWHWLVQVAHLAVGVVAMGLAEQVARAGKARLLDRTLLAEGRAEQVPGPARRGSL
ncbi:MAG: hypothetical protein ACRDI2_02720 [Chloroflexota bacterium]